MPVTVDNMAKGDAVKLASLVGRSGDDNVAYRLAQFHFHWGKTKREGSEHTVAGKQYPLKMHLVHYNTKYADLSTAADKTDGLLVIGVLFEAKTKKKYYNTELQKIIETFHDIDIEEDESSKTVDVNDSLDILKVASNIDFTKYFSYKGSLTTPGCFESVTWVVMHETAKVSPKQLKKFAKIMGHEHKIAPNYRPVQKLNRKRC